MTTQRTVVLEHSIASVVAQVDELRAENDSVREAFAAAVGYYSCPCGAQFEFAEDSTLEEYAALNRWLGRHYEPCASLMHEDARFRIAELEGEVESLRGELASHVVDATAKVAVGDGTGKSFNEMRREIHGDSWLDGLARESCRAAAAKFESALKQGGEQIDVTELSDEDLLRQTIREILADFPRHQAGLLLNNMYAGLAIASRPSMLAVWNEELQHPCPAALNIKGEHFGCDLPAPHDGLAHSSKAAQAIWVDDRTAS
ncbi:hypothetical protein BMW24_003625 [Mycobacterium heckeshornense]|uniref:hypothetical protein n=1 Tax=Mycobacterium heckeshornense TaxID=110505 RepID=UPI000ABE8CD9|nr:hypothetical protein [Mycobacterium heckeshornense]PIJ36765.1 hypothetical protein BMW24_003340 [Mycobacterium heckeshornense]PIJ36816.1 hypothetical protein BMW24_003625 [Mycobacterium heckeshornense]